MVDRLRRRFAIGRVCVVADRGMISAETIAALEARGLLYILGTRERTEKLVREVVLADPAPFVPLTVPSRTRRKESDYGAKAVMLGGRRYIVCINHQEAQKDAADRVALVAALEQQLKRGDKALVANTGYRRFLATAGKSHFVIDRAKVAEDARFDGIFVRRTNTDLNPLAAMLRYKAALDSGAHLPHRQAPVRHPAHLPQARRDHPWPRLLFVPRPGAEDRTGAAHRCPRREHLMARDPERSRRADRDLHGPGRQALPRPLGTASGRQPRSARRRRCPAAHSPTDRRQLSPAPKRSATPPQRPAIAARNQLLKNRHC